MEKLRLKGTGKYAQLYDSLLPTVVGDTADTTQWAQAYLHKARPRLLDDLELADTHIADGQKVLEIGCVPPLMTAALTRLGRDVIGIDIAPDRFGTFVRELELDIRTCDIEREPFPFEDATFDVVMMNEVFEHLRIDLIATISEVRRVMRPGGRLLLCTPNLSSYRGYANLLLHQHASALGARPFRAFSKLHEIGHVGHVREYTTREVVEFLTACGLEPISILHRGKPAGTKEWLASRLSASLLPYVTVISIRPQESHHPQ
jgi:SAM-dependent methyltransferase